MFIRAFCIAITIAALWWSSSSFGLGLGFGDIKIDSTLASPFKASIELRGLSEIDLDAEQFSVTIESNANAAIEYRLERTGDDSARLILFSRAPVTEPLFQFRIEVKWDRSVAARSYDVIIDPPAYASNPAMEKMVATVAPGDSRQALESSEDPAAEIPAEAAPEPIAQSYDVDRVSAAIDPAFSKWLQSTKTASTADALEQPRIYGPTIDGNSIWRVARAVATDNPELNIYQWMYSIWKSNPSAFYRSNMHRLNMGEVLRIPLEREVAEVTRSQAWRTYSDQMTMFEEIKRVSEPEVGDLVHAATEISAASPRAEAAVAEATTQSDSGSGLPAETGEASKLAEITAADSVGRFEGSPAGFVGGDLTEEESLGTPVTLPVKLIEKIESEEASIIVDTPARDGFGATSDGTVTLDSTEIANAGDPIEVQAMLEPIQEVQVGVEPESIATLETELVAVESDGNAAALNELNESAIGWRNSLRSRQQLVAQSPLIGAEAPLAVVGQAIQWTDEYIATRPSWASLAFGVWVTIVILMLSKQIRARRRFAAAVPQVASLPVFQLSPTPVMAPVPESAKPASADQSAQKASARLANNAAAKKPTRTIEIDFNADEILSKADVFMDGKNTDEAVKLLELAIKLQPDQLSFVVRLLEIHHKLKHDSAFESLLERFRPTLAELESSEQVRLQIMYGRLCPQATPLIDPEQAAADEEALSADSQEQAAAQAPHEPELDLVLGDDDGEDYISTEVLVMNNGVLLNDDSRARLSMVGEVLDFEDTLSEIDVYLAYGLYDNAEELILKGHEVYPNRIELLVKMLDTYYATKNLVDFVTCAEELREMGEEVSSEYWTKVEVMGYELAPYNELFSAGKNKSLVGIELEIPKPESADLDIGSEDSSYLHAADLNVAVPDVDADSLSADDDADEFDKDFELGLDEDEVAGQSVDASTDDGHQHSLAELGLTDDLVAEILSDHHGDETTNLNLDDWQTRNIASDKDKPGIIDRVGEGDEDAHEGGQLEFERIVHDDDDTTDINRDDWQTRDITFDKDASVIMELAGEGDEDADQDGQLEFERIADDAGETDEDDEDTGEDDEDAGEDGHQEFNQIVDAASESEVDEDEFPELAGIEDEAAESDEDDELDLDLVAVRLTYSDTDSEPEDAMRFTMVDESEPHATGDDIVDGPMDEAAGDITVLDLSGGTGSGSILAFPDHIGKRGSNNEFESEVKVTLQAIRDQLQFMTERLHRQERVTTDLRQSLTELREQDDASGHNSDKKSS